MLLDDPSPLVRRALAEVVRGDRIPAAQHRSCAGLRPARRRRADSLSLAASARRRSGRGGGERRRPSGKARSRCARCCRARWPRRSPRSAAPRPACCFSKTPTPRSCRSRSTVSSRRHGHLAAIRDVLLETCRPAGADAPGAGGQALPDARRVRHRPRVARARPRRARHPRGLPRAAPPSALAASSPESEVRPLIRHLCESGQLNAGLILRSLLSGNVGFFEEALAELAQVPLARVAGIVHDRKARASARSTTRPACRRPRSSRSARRWRRCARTASSSSRAARAPSSAASSSAR